MTIVLAPVIGDSLLSLAIGQQPSSSAWTFATGNAEFIPAENGGSSPTLGTELAPSLPRVVGGVLQLDLSTFNPGPAGIGTSFWGADLMSIATYQPDASGGIAFTATAKLGSSVPGVDAGIFASGTRSNGNHDEVDFELLGDGAAATPQTIQTNIYQNQPFNTLGDPSEIAVPGLSLSAYHTYTIEWFQNEILWFVDGNLIASTTQNVPQVPMNFILDYWALRINPQLEISTTQAGASSYAFDVQSVSVARIQDLNTTLTIGGTAANQRVSDVSAVSPFSQVTVSDINPGQTDAATVTLSSAASGTLTDLGGGSYDAATGVYSVSGSAAAVTAALDGLRFTPAGHQLTETVTTGFTIAITDGANASASDQAASVIAFGAPAPQDFAGAGTSDILFGQSNGALADWQMNGTSIVGGGNLGNPGGTWSEVGTGDFNGDGRADILFQDASGNVASWEMSGTAIIGGGDIAAPGGSWRVAGVGAFTGANQSDILFQDASHNLALWEMNGTNIVGGGDIGNPGGTWSEKAIGDFNGDGKSDILFQDASGNLAIWEMSGTSIIGGGDIGNPGPGWTVEGTGDFNGDGMSDILFENTSGEYAIWEMHGTAIVGGGDIGNPGGTWQFAGIGDYTGDGMSDILFEDAAGNLAIWEMNGTSIVGGGDIGNPGAVWHVLG